MRFWDSSAVVSLILEEAASGHMRGLHGSDRDMLVWWGTPIECHSGLARGERAGRIPADVKAEADRALREMSLYWTEVEPVASIRDAAIRLVGVHDLRAADALQLAAAVLSRPSESDLWNSCALTGALRSLRRKRAWSYWVRDSNDN